MEILIDVIKQVDRIAVLLETTFINEKIASWENIEELQDIQCELYALKRELSKAKGLSFSEVIEKEQELRKKTTNSHQED